MPHENVSEIEENVAPFVNGPFYYVYLSHEENMEISHTTEPIPGVLLDWSKDRKLLGIEILGGAEE